MAVTITLDGFSPSNILEQTDLTADAAASAVTLMVTNTDNYAVGDSIIIGTLGAEDAEKGSVSAVTAGQLSVAAGLSRAHLSGSPVTKLFGDKANIYRAPNITGLQPADNTFALLAAVDLATDQLSTDYTDQTGSSDYWYKYTYYNQTTGGETPLADSGSMRGNMTRYATIDDVRQEAGFARARYITDSLISAKLAAAQAEIDSTLVGIFTLPFTDPINPFIGDIAQRLAAGLLLLEQFGAYNTANTQNGQSKIDGARADLEKLKERSLTLVDTAGSDIATPNNGAGFNAWPNQETATTDGGDGGGERFFRVSDVQGYRSRKY